MFVELARTFAPLIRVGCPTASGHPPAPTDDQTFPQLTVREREVVELIARGLGNQAVAARLGLSTRTVMNYVSNIFAKLHAADRAEMILRARDAGRGKDSASRDGSDQPTCPGWSRERSGLMPVADGRHAIA